MERLVKVNIRNSFFNAFCFTEIQVFCSGWEPDKQTDFWIVIPACKKYCKSGNPVPFSTIIGLKHQKTSRNLHSHDNESPITKQQEGK